MPTWSAAILAGGRGRRLDGRVKALIEIGGQTILSRQQEMLGSLGVVPFLVAPVAAPFAASGLDIVTDAVEAGALGALYTALSVARTSEVVVLAADMPFVTASLISWMVAHLGTHDAVVPDTSDGRQPLCAVYATRVAPQLRSRIARGAWRVVEALDDLDVRAMSAAEIAPLDPFGRLLVNVNTPGDYVRAERLATA